jgi:putative ABC transport system permease protein
MAETFRMALQVLVRQPGRSALTMLGLTIGVAAFIAMVSFGQGARKSVVSQFESLGSSILRVRSQAGSKDALARPARRLSEQDAHALRREGTTIKDIVPIIRRTVDLSAGGESTRTILQGTAPAWVPLHGFEMAAGGVFDELEAAQAKKVCVLGATPAAALFGEREPLGENIQVGGKFSCRVVGVMAGKGRSIGGSDLDDLVLIPIRAFERQLGLPDGYSVIELSPTQPSLLVAARAEAMEILRRTHMTREGEPDDFDIVSPDDVTRAADQTSKILTGLLAGIAAVSLLVGGIGIMNIQLVSVAERTGEIGIRAAIGASPSQILRQFLVESCLLSGVGSGVGVVLGVLTARLVAAAMGWPSVVDPMSVLGSGLFGFGVGVLFGYVPALRASRLDPIVALRRE